MLEIRRIIKQFEEDSNFGHLNQISKKNNFPPSKFDSKEEEKSCEFNSKEESNKKKKKNNFISKTQPSKQETYKTSPLYQK